MTKRPLVGLKQYRKVAGKWQFIPVARDAKGNPGPRFQNPHRLIWSHCAAPSFHHLTILPRRNILAPPQAARSAWQGRTGSITLGSHQDAQEDRIGIRDAEGIRMPDRISHA